MPNSSMQVAQVIDRLLSRTKNGNQSWKNSAVGNKYQTRIGDFTVEVTGQTSSIFPPSARIKITKLNGIVVAEAGSSSSGVVATISGRAGNPSYLDSHSQAKLNELYEILSNRSDDLDELLSLL